VLANPMVLLPFAAQPVARAERCLHQPCTSVGASSPNKPVYRSIWLIDDDPFANFLTGRLLHQLHFAQQVHTFTTVDDALQSLTQSINQGTELLPEIIFLDLHMPARNGWSFLDSFAELPEQVKARIDVFMLSASEEPADIVKAQRYRHVRGFMAKPLSVEDLELVSGRY
jgi:CheY-like chemotaxis protein